MPRTSATAVTTRLDVRIYPTWERHPRVFAAFDALPIGGQLVIVSDHEPRPLRFEFDQQRAGAFIWDQETPDEDVWHVTIKRVPKEPILTDLLSFLRHCSTLADLDEHALARMADVAEERSFPPGGVLIEQGEHLRALALVRTGLIAAIASSPDGREQLLYEALPFDPCGEIEFFDDGAAPARLVAAYGAAQVVLIPRTRAIEIARQFPMLALRVGRRTALRARELSDRMMHTAFSSTEARVARALLPYAGPAEGLVPTLPPLSQMSQAQIATIAGTVRIVAARGLAKLVKERAIELRRGRVTRIDRWRLQALCN
jgi:CRP/FNR family cyclic AMP-dependent transcriptional regulator